MPSTSTLNHKPQFFNEKKELKAGGKRIEAGGGSISKVAGQAGIVLSSNKGSQEKKSKDYHSMINQIHMMRKEYKTLEDENNQLYSMMKSKKNSSACGQSSLHGSSVASESSGPFHGAEKIHLAEMVATFSNSHGSPLFSSAYSNASLCGLELLARS